MDKCYINDSDFQKRNSQTTHFITTTNGGFSTGNYSTLNLGLYCGEDPSITRRNYNLLCSDLHITEDKLFVPREIHSNQVSIIDNSFLALNEPERALALSNADALITQNKNIAVAVSTADCVPIICTDNRTTVAAIHAGWRGIVSGVVDSTLQELANIGCDISQFSFLIGPCIAGNSYEVDLDVWSEFCNRFDKTEQESILVKQTNSKFYPDLRTAVTIQLKKHTNPNNIYNVIADTFTDSQFYSVRRNGAKTGRFLTGIMLKG